MCISSILYGFSGSLSFTKSTEHVFLFLRFPRYLVLLKTVFFGVFSVSLWFWSKRENVFSISPVFLKTAFFGIFPVSLVLLRTAFFGVFFVSPVSPVSLEIVFFCVFSVSPVLLKMVFFSTFLVLPENPNELRHRPERFS